MRSKSIVALVLAGVVWMGAACSDNDEAADVTFGPASTLEPPRTVPPEAQEFCSLRASTIAVGDLFSQLEEPLQLLVERRYSEAIEPVGQLYDAIDTATGVLEDIKSTAPQAIASEVALVADRSLEGFALFPVRDDFVQALEAEDEQRVTTALEEFEAGITFLSEPQSEVDAAATAMRDYIAVIC